MDFCRLTQTTKEFVMWHLHKRVIAVQERYVKKLMPSCY